MLRETKFHMLGRLHIQERSVADATAGAIIDTRAALLNYYLQQYGVYFLMNELKLHMCSIDI
jgi:hypothetical protein